MRDAGLKEGVSWRPGGNPWKKAVIGDYWAKDCFTTQILCLLKLDKMQRSHQDYMRELFRCVVVPKVRIILDFWVKGQTSFSPHLHSGKKNPTTARTDGAAPPEQNIVRRQMLNSLFLRKIFTKLFTVVGSAQQQSPPLLLTCLLLCSCPPCDEVLHYLCT